MRRRMWMAALLGGLAAVFVLAVPAATQRGPERPDCAPEDEAMGFVSTTGAYPDGSLPDSAGYATEEQAVEAEAYGKLQGHDPGSTREPNGHAVRRDDRTAAVFQTKQLSNGRWTVEGGVLCQDDFRER